MKLSSTNLQMGGHVAGQMGGHVAGLDLTAPLSRNATEALRDPCIAIAFYFFAKAQFPRKIMFG